MNENRLYAAIAGIDEKYLAASENAVAVTASIRAAKQKRNATLFSVFACLVLAAAAAGPVKHWLQGAAPNVDPTTPLPSESTQADATVSTRDRKETDPDILSETDPSQATTNPGQNDSEPVTTTSMESNTTAPPITDPESVTSKADDSSDIPTSTGAASASPSGAQSYNGPLRLQAAMEENVCGWIKYNGAYYLQDDWSNGNTIEHCEPVGSSSAIEGNLERLGLTGEVFLVAVDDNYAGCLLLKTDTGRSIVFIPVPEAD